MPVRLLALPAVLAGCAAPAPPAAPPAGSTFPDGATALPVTVRDITGRGGLGVPARGDWLVGRATRDDDPYLLGFGSAPAPSSASRPGTSTPADPTRSTPA